MTLDRKQGGWPDRRLIDLLRIEHPIVLAPMVGATTIELAGSVCAAGGLGSIGCAAMTPQIVAATIEQWRLLTKGPINLNFFCHVSLQADSRLESAWRNKLEPYYEEAGLPLPQASSAPNIPPFNDAFCSVIEASRPEVVSFHFGLPASSLVARVKAAGCLVMSSATTVEEARWLEDHGADVIIAQGNDAGGHRGMFLSPDIDRESRSQPGTFALVPQIVDCVEAPVVAAGGVSDARGIVAALALGAAGVQMGTAYLLCPEAATPPLYRAALRRAQADLTVVTSVFTGRPARALLNRLTRDAGSLADAVPPFPTAMSALAPLRAEAEQRGCDDFSAFWSGQAAALAREMAAEPLTRAFVAEALQRIGWLARSCSG